MRNYIVLFGLGAFAYGLIEVVWRGHTHWSMMLAGGICFIAFSLIAERLKGLRLIYKCILGSLTVTSVELIFGCIFNLAFGLGIWDYSSIPLNLFGQICLLFSVMWGFLSLAAIPAAGAAYKLLGKEKPHELSAQSLG